MDGSRSLRRLVARGLMLVAALVAVCAFHSAADQPGHDAVSASSISLMPAVEVGDPLQVRLVDVPWTYPSADSHAHLAVVSLMGLSLSLLLLGLVARACRTVVVRPRDPSHNGWGFGPPDPPWPATPSLTQLRVSRT
ncbi:hypothetical protein [Kribbella sp. CA-294648]|uniref:hypothetical protein n=1 Tax=Kribbella sp. CA-294648 TaxID=3239948 RepID=UPI003D8A183E